MNSLFEEGFDYRVELVITQELWKKISERVKADLKSFTKGKPGAETLEKNLEEATRDRYDYGEILQRFTVTGEDLTVNDDEFDYVTPTGFGPTGICLWWSLWSTRNCIRCGNS